MNIQLRPWTMSDLDRLVVIADNHNISKNMTDKFVNPYTTEQGKNFIEFATSSTPEKILAIIIEDQIIGVIGIHPQTDIYSKNAELGYWLAEEYWGKGIMTKAIIQMVNYGFKTWDLNRIFARPFGTNYGSQRALEKAGFLLEGKSLKTIYKNGMYIDELVYSIRK